MLNGDDNENGFKTNRSNNINKKPNSSCSTLLLLISKKQICTWARFFVFPLPLFCTTTTLFCTTKTSNFLVSHIIFVEELSYVLTQYFVSCVHVRFYFSLPLILTLLAAMLAFLIFSPPLWISMFVSVVFTTTTLFCATKTRRQTS